MGREQEAAQQKHWDEWGLTPARVRQRALAVEAERDRLREALENAAGHFDTIQMYARGQVTQYARARENVARVAADGLSASRSALSPESNPEGQ